MSGPIVIPAEDWRQHSWRPLVNMPSPAQENWVHHSGDGAKTLTTLRGNETFHVRQRRWRALGYSWAVVASEVDNGFARIYEGRSWGKQGAHTGGRNEVSHGFLLVGGWNSATSAEIEAAAKSIAWLILEGTRRGYTHKAVSGGHRDAPGASTTCPDSAGMQVVARVEELLKNPDELRGDGNDPRFEMLLYALRGTPDYGAASAAADLAGLVATSNRSEAQKELERGGEVLAVGGPAADDLPDAEAVRGRTGLATMEKLAKRLQ